MVSRARCIWRMIVVLCILPPCNVAPRLLVSTGHEGPNTCSLSVSAETARYKSAHPNQDERLHLLKLFGLTNSAVVSGSVSVSVAGISPDLPVTYCLDGVPIWVALHSPHSLGEEQNGTSKGFSLHGFPLGEHHLQAVLDTSDGNILLSDVVALHVVQTMNHAFSQNLTAYALQSTVQQPLAAILEHTATPGAGLTQEEMDTRYQVAAMYLNFGIDISLDYAADQSTLMTNLLPRSWGSPNNDAQAPLSMRFSRDAPFYQSIPMDWPRVRLPRGYLKTVQLNTNQYGDGIGYGIAVARSDSPLMTITSMWHAQEDTRKTVNFRVPRDWPRSLPTLEAGDQHMIFVDPVTETFVSLYKASVNAQTGQPNSLYVSSPTPLNSLGDHGGSTASGFAELPLLIQPGEATDEQGAIRHALGGPVSRAWAARVYPAASRDYGVLTSTNSCTGKGVTNTGLVPYGGIIQLDPSLDLTHLKLSRPAFRILRAMQTYGYYVMDFGCADLDIYTAISEKELLPYGGLYGLPLREAGVQTEIARVITMSDLYVVPPLVKRP
jgi:hypothetical protein